MCRDALVREESCGGHFRVEHQVEGEAKRDDEKFCHAAVWEHAATQSADPPHRAARVRERQARDAELQVSGTSRTSRSTSGARRIATTKGDVRHVQGHGRLDARLVPRDARHPQRAADRQGRRAGRVRSRLPRRHLRHVLADDQRPRRTAAAARTTTCQLHMRLFNDGDEIWIEPWRAAAFPVIKDLVRRPQRVRPHHRGRRLHHRERRLGARRERHPDPEGSGRPRDGCGRVHRLRRVRRRVPERLGDAVRRREARPPAQPAAGPARALAPHAGDGQRDGRRGLRRVHEPLRVRSRLPEGHPARRDGGDAPRLREGRVRAPRPLRQGRRRLIADSCGTRHRDGYCRHRSKWRTLVVCGSF